jgi:cytochrome P450
METTLIEALAIFANTSARDPAPLFAGLRDDSPVHWLPGFDAWLITRHEDVRLLFADPRVTADPRAYEKYTAPAEGSAARWLDEMPFRAAPAECQSLGRRLVSAAFTPRAVKRMEECVGGVVEDFAAPLRGRSGVVDLIGAFTSPISSGVIGRILGVPPNGSDTERFVKLARKATRAINPFLSPEKREQTERASVEIGEYVLGLIPERRKVRRPDLISDLLEASASDSPATDGQIAAVVAGIVSAGTGTAGISGARAIRTLFHHPEQLEALREDRSLLPNAVEELLRFDSGVFGMPRYVIEDFELRGQILRKGQLVVLSLMGANRDPRVFDDPDRLDLRRDARDSLSFGHGPHFCIGASLARVELRRMLDAALDFLPSQSLLQEDAIRWSTGGILSQLRSLPVHFGN